jgi:hypothetical protein
LISREVRLIDEKYTTTVCGSFRRGADSSGDIDILITHPTYFFLIYSLVTSLKYFNNIDFFLSYVSGSYSKERSDLNLENLIVQSKKSPKSLLDKIINRLVNIGFIHDTISFGDTKYMVKFFE